MIKRAAAYAQELAQGVVLRCYACDRKLGARPRVADTRDDQIVVVGPECWRHIRQAGAAGWQPARGGPRLYPPTS